MDLPLRGTEQGTIFTLTHRQKLQYQLSGMILMRTICAMFSEKQKGSGIDFSLPHYGQ